MSIYGGWETLDTAALLARREEATTFSNVGPYTVPLGSEPLRREIPVGQTGTFPSCDGDRFCTLGPTGFDLWDDPLARRMY